MPDSAGSLAPFDDAPGVWLRCALHVHTSESDGWLTPEIQRRYHAWAGYDVLAITDHDRYTPEPVGDDGLLIIGGTEISLTAPRSGGPLHVLGLGITSPVEVDRTASLAETALAIRETGGLPFVAHPVWSGLHTDEIDGIEHCTGIEIFNAGCEVEQGRGHADAHADIWLAMGHRLSLLATDDTHYAGYDAFQGWTMVRARERTRAAVLDALAAGHFYGSSGPRILGMSLVDDVLAIRTTPARSIAAIANPQYGARVSAGQHSLAYRGSRLRTSDDQTTQGMSEGEWLTGARFRWHPAMRYVRIVITDLHGNRAWSNPIWVDAG